MFSWNKFQLQGVHYWWLSDNWNRNQWLRTITIRSLHNNCQVKKMSVRIWDYSKNNISSKPIIAIHLLSLLQEMKQIKCQKLLFNTMITFVILKVLIFCIQEMCLNLIRKIMLWTVINISKHWASVSLMSTID